MAGMALQPPAGGAVGTTQGAPWRLIIGYDSWGKERKKAKAGDPAP